jgi:hypothetical protein
LFRNATQSSGSGFLPAQPIQFDTAKNNVLMGPASHLAAVREKFLAITDGFATLQAQCLNVRVEFPLLQRLALPITVGTAKFPGINFHDTRMIRLMEVLLHGGTTVGGWTAKQIHDALLTAFQLSAARYGLNQLRYDLRKMKAHGLIERDGKRYAYRLTGKGTKVALTFVLFHQRLCGALCKQPLLSPTQQRRPTQQQIGSRVPQSRRIHPQRHPTT